MRSKIHFIVLGLALLSACGDENRRVTWESQGETMGTTFSVSVVTPRKNRPENDLGQRVSNTLDSVEKSMSTYLLDSEVSRFNTSRSTDWFSVSQMVCAAVADSLEISVLTDGAFDITVGPLVNLWGFGPEGARREPPDRKMIADAKERVGYRQITTDCKQPALRKSRADVYIDLSGYAKGFAVDRVAEVLESAGLEDYMIEVGGEVRMSGRNGKGDPWRVAIESPDVEARKVQRIVNLTDVAMATSGDYRNFFEFANQRYSHTIDPRRGSPITHDLAAVTVVSDKAAFADAMATALLVLGPRDGMHLAESRDLAVFFQRREKKGFAQSMSPQFRRLANQH